MTDQDPSLPTPTIKRHPELQPRINGRLAILVPVYNEADCIAAFLEATRPYLEKIKHKQIIFVNDGSQDETLSVLLKEAEVNPDITVINLARNFGKEAAMAAGLDYCDADAVIVMDVDLQDPPELIPDFYQYWQDGYDVVLGERANRQSDAWLKRKAAESFYSVFNRLSPTQIPHNVGDFRLLDKRVVAAIRELRERNRFTKGIYAWVGFNTICVPYKRPVRVAGKTKFKLRGLWNFALDGIFGFSTIPLKLSIYMGMLVGIAAMFYAIFLIIRTLVFGVDIPGYASLMVVILVLSSGQLFSMGIIGEYIARLTIEAKQRPLYIIEGHYSQSQENPS